MDNRSQPEIDTDLIINSYNRRTEARVELPITLYLRRPHNSSNYHRAALVENVSRRGARIILDLPLEVGAQLTVTGLEDRFCALAAVRYCLPRWDGYWSIGISFIKKQGQWIIS